MIYLLLHQRKKEIRQNHNYQNVVNLIINATKKENYTMAQVSDARRARYRQEVLDNATSKFNTTQKMAYYKLVPGTWRLRILPGLDPASADKDFFCKGIAHYFVSPTNPKIPVICPKSKNPKAFCPVCEQVQTLSKSANKADNLTADKLRGKARYYMGVFVREGEDAGKVMVYSAPKVVYMKVLTYLEDTEYGDITHPTEGYDLKISRTGTGKDTRYDVTASPKVSPISDDPAEIEQVLANQPELWRFREAPSSDEIEKFMAGEISRFTTGGFATKSTEFPDTEEKDPVPFEPTSVEDLAEVSPMLAEAKQDAEEDKERAEANVPPIVKKAKRFANLDKIKEELK
jgi:hypothetical protein